MENISKKWNQVGDGFSHPVNIFKRYVWFLVGLAFLVSSCRKGLDVPAPITSVNGNNVFAKDKTAIQVMNSVYVQLSGHINADEITIGGLFFSGGLLSDELTLYAPGDDLYYKNGLLGTMVSSQSPWADTYNLLFTVNSVINGVSASTTLTPAVKKQLLGEAKFMRGFLYFYLVNLYGDTPLALSTDPNVNRLLKRSPASDVYAQIIADLKDAQAGLSNDFLGADLKSATTERVRPTSWAATALLARVYLYKGDYTNASDNATVVINNSNQFGITPLDQTFLMNSQETIWALQPVNSFPTANTFEGSLFILPSSGPGITDNSIFPVYLSKSLYNSFEKGDLRQTSWIDSVQVGSISYPYAYKYKQGYGQSTVTEYEVVFRLAEQYLIRAEAKARLNDVAGAVADLNLIRTRARAAATVAVPNPLPNLTTSLSQNQLYAAIEHERQTELFTEWGHRWFDLKRTPGFSDPSVTRADEVMSVVTPLKGGTWSPNWKLLPIPLDQLQQDPNMTNAQNPGY